MCPAAEPSTCNPTALIWSQLSAFLSSSSWPCHDFLTPEESSCYGFSMTTWRKKWTHVFTIFSLVQDLGIYYIFNPPFLRKHLRSAITAECNWGFPMSHSHVAQTPRGRLVLRVTCHRRGACPRGIYYHKYTCWHLYCIAAMQLQLSFFLNFPRLLSNILEPLLTRLFEVMHFHGFFFS